VVNGIYVECDSCEARGPCIEVERVGYPESMFTTVSVAPNGDTIDTPLRVVGRCNDEYYKFKRQATQKAEAAAIAAWNQRSTWQPIETAPRGGKGSIEVPTEILVWDGYEMRVELPQVGYRPRDTHWQPLPSPPITPNPHD
jgi:hypothetical protein